MENWAEAQDAAASEGWRKPVYHCALTQSRKEQSQGMPHEKERQAQNVLALGVRESEASQTLTQKGAWPLTASTKAGWPDHRREHQPTVNSHLFHTTHSKPLSKLLIL